MGKKRKPWIPPPPLDSAILVAEDALVSGADVLITGGAHKRIHGLKGYILPSSEENSATVNVRLYQGHATLQSKIWCVDRSNVAVSGPGPPVEDDGLHPSLRWRLRPPPLTVFSVRFVLGWQSLATMVPMKPDKRPQQGTPGSGRQPVTRLWQGVRRISKEGALLPQPLASARGDPPCTFEAAERAPVAAAFGKEKPREVPDTISTKTKTSSLSQYGVAPGHRKHKRRDEQEEMVEVEIEDDERSTALMTGYPGRGSYALMIPDDRQVSRSHLDDTGLPPPLAAGNGVLDLESNQVSVTCPNRAQGWVDCYQVDTCIAGLSPYNYAVGAELDEPCTPAPPHISTDTTGKLPKAAIAGTQAVLTYYLGSVSSETYELTPGTRCSREDRLPPLLDLESMD
ncbi:unnamed protein product [Symbiodinium sp. KB8]|nr:unnamed protein product [Symbiodinium sp. KB8]